MEDVVLCLSPIEVGLSHFPCGKCDSCRVNRLRDWTARLLLHEAGHVGVSAFVTLTYSDAQLPRRGSDGEACLAPGDLRWFVQRLRRACGKLRYCVVGEYGERTKRPHYHALLWAGVGVDLGVEVRKAWSKGFVDVGEVSEASIIYTIGYLLKGVLRDDVYAGFARFSEGLGTSALPELRRCALAGEDGELSLPREFRLEGQVWPLPKYLRAKLVDEGFTFNRRDDEVLEETFVQALRKGARDVAVRQVVAFRKAVAVDVESRRARARARLESGVHSINKRRKYETL